MSPKTAFDPLASRFEVAGELGRGGAGIVYAARDRLRGNRVALKTLGASTPENLLAFKREFRSLQDLHHRNLVSLGELFEVGGQLFFSMELVEGVRFTEYVRRAVTTRPPTDIVAGALDPPTASLVGDASMRSALSTTLFSRTASPRFGAPSSVSPIDLSRVGATAPDDVSRVSRTSPTFTEHLPWPPSETQVRILDEGRLRAAAGELALGLHALHRAGKVHRDVKPSNVLVADDGRVVVLDFGLIAELGHGDGHVVGTAHFMAPEQAAGLPVGPAADWYSVGVMLFLSLTGRFPFEGTAAELLDRKQHTEPRPPGDLANGLPADLVELTMALLRRAPEHRPLGPEVLARLGLRDAHEAPRSDEDASAFVGRARELAALGAAQSEVLGRQRGTAIFIEAESGMGKSALVRRFLQGVPRSTVTLSGRCYERDRVPYKAADEVIEHLAGYLQSRTHQELAALLPVEATFLAAIFPILGALPALARPSPLGATVLDPLERRARAFSALRTILERIAASSPLIVTIDDLQWADAESLALLTALLDEPTPPFLTVLTLRVESTNAPRRLAAHTAAPASARRVLRLEGLSPDEARSLVAALVTRGSAQGGTVDVEQVVAEAAGHPLFLDALARYPVAHAPREAGRPRAAVRLEDALWARVARLSPAARRVLQACAVGDGRLNVTTVAHATSGDVDEVWRWVAELRASRLVCTSEEGDAGVVETTHDRVRQTVRDRLPSEARRAWHGRVALALEFTEPTELESLAYHWAEASHAERAAVFSAKAADRAAAALAFDRAATLYRRTLDLHVGGERDAHRIRVRLGDALANAGRGKEAADAYFEAIASAAPEEVSDLRRRAAENLLRSGYFDEGASSMRHVLTDAGIATPASPATALLTLLTRRARLFLRGLSFRERDETEVPPRLLTRVDVCWSAALGFGMSDNLRGACFQALNLALALEAGEPYRVARAIALEIPFVSTAGAPSRARVAHLAETASVVAERTGHPHARALVPAVCGVAETLRGAFRQSLTSLDAADTMLRTTCTGVPWERSSVRTFAMWDLFLLGDIREFTRRMPISLQEAEGRGDRYFATNLRSFFCNAFWLVKDDPEQAIRQVEIASAGWSHDGFHLQHFYELVARTHAALYVDDAERARRYIADRWQALVRSLTLRIEFAMVFGEWARGSAAIARGPSATPLDDRLRTARQAARTIARRRLPYGDALATLLEAGVAAATRDDDVARDLYETAATRFEAADMASYAAVTRYRLGAHVGGDEGTATQSKAAEWMRAQGIAAPERIAAMIAPPV